MSQDRITFRLLAEARLHEARLLLANGMPSGAYYLAGYAVECALKAIIAGKFLADQIPDRRLVERVYVHDLGKLLSLAGLEAEMKEKPDLHESWATIENWSERARYEVWTQASASVMIEALGGDEGFTAMATESLIEAKLEASEQLAQQLIERGSPLFAAYWEFREEVDRWKLVLVPPSESDERLLIKQSTQLLIGPPYRSVFSLSDPSIDSRQIDRARALGAYIRVEPYIGRRIDTTFTGGQYFESVVPVYLAPELMTHLRVA